jgi:hypothetical protein
VQELLLAAASKSPTRFGIFLKRVKSLGMLTESHVLEVAEELGRVVPESARVEEVSSPNLTVEELAEMGDISKPGSGGMDKEILS